MAVVLKEINEKDTIKVIAKCDSSIDGVSSEDYDSYLKDLDEEKLSFVEGEQPTRFVLRLSLPALRELELEDNQVEYGKKGKAKFKMSTRMFEQVRMSLIAVENPEGTESPIVYKKHNEFGASVELVQMLNRAGIVTDLFSAIENAQKGVLSKKK